MLRQGKQNMVPDKSRGVVFGLCFYDGKNHKATGMEE